MSNRIMFLRDQKFQPVGCLAISHDRGTNIVKFQLSVLNPADRFRRDVARQIAIGRLIEKPIVIPLLGEREPSRTDITFSVMDCICNSKFVPGRARKMARLWLENFRKNSTEADECC